jgi:GNAT superfamily N-acetyltransferase
MEYGGLDGWVDDLFVRPAFRRHGLARAALEALIAECERRGVLALHVEVGRENDAARPLYERFGLAPREDDRVTLTRRLRQT